MNLPQPPRRDVRSLLCLLALQTLLLLPFLGQAVHMDDSIYLDIARNILQKPFHPYDFPYCFEGYCAPDMASHSHPPFIGYWLAACMKLFGGSAPVWILHLTYLPFAWLFALSVLILARRFSSRPLLVSMIAASSPVIMVMSHNLMSDYPNLAFWAAALAFYVTGVDRGRPGWIWVAGIFMVFSAFASYPSLLVPLLCWFYALQRKPCARAAWWVPVIPFLWMGVWLGYSSWYFGRFVLGGTGRYFIENRGTWSLSMLVEKLITLPVFLAGTVFLPGNLVWRACRWLGGRLALLALLASAVITQACIPDYALPEKLLFVFLISAGEMAAVSLAAGFLKPAIWGPMDAAERRDCLFLWLWMGTVTFLLCFVYAATSARYLMPLSVPFILLCSNRYLQDPSSMRFRLLELSCLGGLILALALSMADYQAAGANRDLAARLGGELVGWEGRVRFGAEWGLRHYLQEEGFRQFISTSADFNGGDIIVLPEVAIPYVLPQDTESMSFQVAARSSVGSMPLRLMSRKAHAGFYSSGWGWLPFSFSRAPLESLKLLQVCMLVEKLPEIQIETPQGMGVAVPLRGSGGQVDLRMPPAFKMAMPLEFPLSLVSYKWCQRDAPASNAARSDGIPPQEPNFQAHIRIRDTRQLVSVQAAGPLRHEAGYWCRDYRMALPSVSQGELYFGTVSGSGNPASESLVRNWRMLPPAWIQGLP